MTGNEKGRKKRNRITLRVRFKEKQSVNGIAYPYLRWRSKSIHYMPNSKSGRGSFRHFYFSNITFHFYMYKVLRGIGEVSEERCNDEVKYCDIALFLHCILYCLDKTAK